ncbi:MAG: alpha/beta fold hydrolase [Planctomycetes bacterium]|nr:alpha/beta fold hydrolase [Planctomycetota bacterium]
MLASRCSIWFLLVAVVALIVAAVGCGQDDEGLRPEGPNQPSRLTLWQEAERHDNPDPQHVRFPFRRPAASGGEALNPESVDHPGKSVRYPITLAEAIPGARMVIRYAREKWGQTIPPAEFTVTVTGGGWSISRKVSLGDTGGWGQEPGQWRLRGVLLGDLPAGPCVVELAAANQYAKVLLDGFWIAPTTLTVTVDETSGLSRILCTRDGWLGVAAADAVVNQLAGQPIEVTARCFDGRRPELVGAVEGVQQPPSRTGLPLGSLAPGQSVALATNGKDVTGDRSIRTIDLKMPKLDDGIYVLRLKSVCPQGEMTTSVMFWGELLTELDAMVQRIEQARERLEARGGAEAARCLADFEHAVKYLKKNRDLLSDYTFDIETVIRNSRRVIEQSGETLRRLDAGEDPYTGRSGDLRRALRVGDKLVPYRVVVPENYEQVEKLPLAILVHGAGESEDIWLDMGDSVVAREAARRGYLVISPRRLAEDENYTILSDFLAQVVKEYPRIDLDRVFLGGHSRGGFASWELAARDPTRFRAIACVSGVTDAQLAARLKGVPVLLIHGEKDTTVPAQVTRDAAAELKRLGFDCELHLFPDKGHELRNHADEYVKLIFDSFDRYR